jgi:hypothetical protein
VPDIFDEVDEDLRADQARALLKRYAGTMVAAALLVVVASGGYQAWRWYDARQTAAVATQYLDAMHLADTAKGADRTAAAVAFDAVAHAGREGYRTLARLREAGVKADAGDLDGASTLWDSVAGDGSADPLLRDLASLQWAIHHVDSGDPAVVAGRLATLSAPSNPWHPMAEETQAMLDLRQGKTAAARDVLKSLAQDVTAPQGVRRSAGLVLTRLGG